MFSHTVLSHTLIPSTLIAAVAIAAAVVVGPAAAPASAATLATGDALYGVSCDWAPDDGGHKLFALDAVSAVGFSIGDDASESPYFCALSTSWAGLADECTAYTVTRDPDDTRALFRTDLVTGVSTFVSGFSEAGVAVKISSVALDGAGVAWALGGDLLYRVNLTDGSVTFVGVLPGVGWLGSLVWSPSDSSLYATGSAAVYRVDPVALTAVPVFTAAGVAGGPIGLIEAITVDSAGTVWISERDNDPGLDPAEWTYALWSVAPGGTAERHGRIMVDGVKLGTAALLALPPTADCGQLPTLPFTEPGTPAPAALAATGSDSPVPLILLAGGVTLLGVGLLALASRRRPRRSRS